MFQLNKFKPTTTSDSSLPLTPLAAGKERTEFSVNNEISATTRNAPDIFKF